MEKLVITFVLIAGSIFNSKAQQVNRITSIKESTFIENTSTIIKKQQ